MRNFLRTHLKLLSLTIVTMRGLLPGSRAISSERLPVQGGAEPRIGLPPPDIQGRVPLEQAMARRRSVREFTTEPLSENELSQLLWAAQGVTDPHGRRTAPSAGGLYALEVYIGTAKGFYHYAPRSHELELRGNSDLRPSLYWAAQCRRFIRAAPAVFVITAVCERIEHEYGSERGPIYAHLEAGHAAQNILLQATALGLGGVPVGGFFEDQVSKALRLACGERPVYLIAVGHPAQPFAPSEQVQDDGQQLS